VTALSGLSLLAGSLATRFGIFEGGVASAKDPKYTVVPQRERLDAQEAGPGTSRKTSPGPAADGTTEIGPATETGHTTPHGPAAGL
jgi:hypothetical protein